MHPAAIILTLISVTYVRSYAMYPGETEILKMLVTSSDTSAQNNNPPPSSYVYPTYPEYINDTNSDSLTEENENHSDSLTEENENYSDSLTEENENYSDSLTEENENHSPTMIVQTTEEETPRTAVQTTSRWSYENIVSSLIFFVKNLPTYGSLIRNFVMRFWMVILVGIISTGVICMHTSICKFPNIEIKELASTYITSQNLDYFTTMILGALDKYNSTQDKKDEAQQNKSQKIQNTKIQDKKIQDKKIQDKKIQNKKIQNKKIQNTKIQNTKIQNTKDSIRKTDTKTQ